MGWCSRRGRGLVVHTECAAGAVTGVRRRGWWVRRQSCLLDGEGGVVLHISDGRGKGHTYIRVVHTVYIAGVF